MNDTELERRLLAAIRNNDLDEFDQVAAEATRRDDEREARLRAPGALREAAEWYARHGISVFPLKPRDKRPLFKAVHPEGDPLRDTCQGACGKNGHGLYDASTDITKVQRWWTETPTANIGVRTGLRFDVIDIDGPAGYQSLADLRSDVPPSIGKATTPRGGLHIYIHPTGDGNGTNIAPSVDYRGAGGYAVVAPSIGPNGNSYEWTTPLDLAALVATQ